MIGRAWIFCMNWVPWLTVPLIIADFAFAMGALGLTETLWPAAQGSAPPAVQAVHFVSGLVVFLSFPALLVLNGASVVYLLKGRFSWVTVVKGALIVINVLVCLPLSVGAIFYFLGFPIMV